MEKLQTGWAREGGRMLEQPTDARSDLSIPRTSKEALPGRTCEGDQQGCAGSPCSLSVLLP